MNEKGIKWLKMALLAFIAVGLLLLSVGSTVSAQSPEEDKELNEDSPIELPPNPPEPPIDSEYNISFGDIEPPVGINPPRNEDREINSPPGPPQQIPQPPEDPEPPTITPPGDDDPQPQPPLPQPNPPTTKPANLK